MPRRENRLPPGLFAGTLRKKIYCLTTGIPVLSLGLPLAIPATMWETGWGMKPTEREVELRNGKK